MIRNRWFARGVAVLAAVVALPGSAAAYDEPPVNLGFTTFVDGVPPAGPGWYFQQYLQFYHADRFTTSTGSRLKWPTPRGPKNAELDAFISLSQVIYQSNQEILLHGKWGVDVIVPFVVFGLDPKGLLISDSDPGFGDLLVGPFLQWDPIMGEQGPIFVHRIEFQCLIPTGRYTHGNEINPGSGFFSFNPYWSLTWFPTSKCSFSARVHYLWNDENTDPSTTLYPGIKKVQAGQAVHLNFASSYELIARRLRVGVNGYYLKQVENTQADGIDVPHSKEQVFAIGPGLLYSFSQNDHIFFNAYYEMATEYRTRGQRYTLRWTHHF